MLVEKTDTQARKVSKAGTQGKQEVTSEQVGTYGRLALREDMWANKQAGRQPGKQCRQA
jgi:hypothetical protein